ncbi:MAG: hypothetical protein RJB55_3 [Verrucomicrobiota bacterium]
MLLLVTSLVWVAHHGRFSATDWSLPTDYSGDAHEVLARIKAAGEGVGIPLVPQRIERLGAPFGADWSDYPTPDKPVMLLLGVLSRWTGVFLAANLGLLLAQLASAASFYLLARWLRVRWEWAWAGALLYAYSYHVFHRGLAHFSFVLSWTVPVGLLAVWLVAKSRRLEWKSRGALVCLGASAGLGAGNPYLLLFWGQLLLWALVVQWLGPRRRANLGLGISAGVVAVAVFLICNAELWLHAAEPEGLPLLSRNYGGTERYALKPVEMFIPPEFHRADWLAFLGQRYRRWSEWHGEAFLPYLGVCGIAGLVWLAGLAVVRLLRGRPVPGQALTAGWLIAYAGVGGLTNFIAFFAGFQVFRATNRVAVFISALVLVFLMVRLSRLTARWPAGLSMAAALALAAIGLLDQLPRASSAERRERIAAEATSDRELGARLEAALPPGARVFQLPVLGFPEVVPPHRLTDYEHFRPYLATDGLRFSYGAAKHRARGRWQRELENEPVPVLVRRLEEHGFGALYLNRKGFGDRAEGMLRELAALGYGQVISGRMGNQVVVLLRPKADPQPPFARSFSPGRGWNLRSEDGVRWGGGATTLSFYNPLSVPVTLTASLELVGATAGEVQLWRGQKRLARAPLGMTSSRMVVDAVEMAPGLNVFRLESSQVAPRGPGARGPLRAIGLLRSSVGPPGAPAVADN